ncbi:DUF2088 domain-containing protein [candidate division WOR-3 bacterium]|nr:DUF2088 domain-containing protein [candidate division WOR-3 bacterium]
MKIKLPWGRKLQEFEIPASDVNIVTPHDLPGVPNLRAEFRNSLRNPIGSKSLKEIVGQASLPCRQAGCLSSLDKLKIVLIISDNTRQIPRRDMILAVLEEIPKSNTKDISIVIANGLHKWVDPKSLNLGVDIINEFPIYNHNAWDEDNLISVGFTSSKIDKYSKFQLDKIDFDLLAELATDNFIKESLNKNGLSAQNEVKINKLVAEADLKILLGTIKPHYFAGYSGGIKSLIPGVAGADYIIRNHFLKTHPSSELGKVEGNLVRDDLEEAGKLCGSIFCFDVILNSQGKVVGSVAGDSILAHRKGVEICKPMAEIDATPVDVVVVSDTFPVNINIKQLKKVVAPAAKIAKPHGVIIVVGECQAGVGEETELSKLIYNYWLQTFLSPDVSLLLISDVSPKDVNFKTPFTPMPSVEEAFKFAFKKLGTKVDVSVLPNASSVIPIIS